MTFHDDLLAAAKESAVERYQDGEQITSIAKSFGVRREKVYKWLTELGAYEKAGKPGARRQSVCQNGHDMEEWGRQVKSGGRYCLLCKKARDSTPARRQYRAKRDQELREARLSKE